MVGLSKPSAFAHSRICSLISNSVGASVGPRPGLPPTRGKELNTGLGEAEADAEADADCRASFCFPFAWPSASLLLGVCFAFASLLLPVCFRFASSLLRLVERSAAVVLHRNGRRPGVLLRLCFAGSRLAPGGPFRVCRWRAGPDDPP